MNNSNNLERSVKSAIWMVATILTKIIITFLIFVLIFVFIFLFFEVHLFNFFQLFGGIVGWVLIWLLFIATTIYTIRLGVKSVFKKSIIIKKQISKISFGVAVSVLILLVLITGIIIWKYILLLSEMPTPQPTIITPGMPEPEKPIDIFIEAFLIIWIFGLLTFVSFFVTTYYWFKKLS